MKTIAALIVICVAFAVVRQNLPTTFDVTEVPEMRQSLAEMNVVSRMLASLALEAQPYAMQDLGVIKVVKMQIRDTDLLFVAVPGNGWHLVEKADQQDAKLASY
jgi:hypothetical protein